MLNKVILIGNVGADVKTQTFNNGGMCTKFNVATTFKTKVNNEYVENTTWHPIQVYGSNAKYAAEYLGTGDKVYIEGSIKVDNVQNQQGQQQQFRYVVINHPSHRLQIVAKSNRDQQETQNTNSYNRNSNGYNNNNRNNNNGGGRNGGRNNNYNNSSQNNNSYNNNNTGYNNNTNNYNNDYSNEYMNDEIPF